jgi:hypothetical protein
VFPCIHELSSATDTSGGPILLTATLTMADLSSAPHQMQRAQPSCQPCNNKLYSCAPGTCVLLAPFHCNRTSSSCFNCTIPLCSAKRAKQAAHGAHVPQAHPARLKTSHTSVPQGRAYSAHQLKLLVHGATLLNICIATEQCLGGPCCKTSRIRLQSTLNYHNCIIILVTHNCHTVMIALVKPTFCQYT